MEEERRFTEREAHRHFAAALFNHTWDLLVKAERTPGEDDEMLHAAHASRYHWGVVGTARNIGVGEWQLSRVNAVLGRPAEAAHHAQRSLAIATEHDLGPFHLGYAHEALARAARAAGEREKCADHVEQARGHAAHVADARDRDLLTADLASLDP